MGLKHLMIVSEPSESAVLDKFNFNSKYTGGTDPLQPWKAKVDGQKLLYHIRWWAAPRGLKFDEYDSIMYYHSYPMIGAMGWALTGAICTPNAVSVIQDDGWETWTTTAHEFAHTLGAQHDDATSGECASSLLYIMTRDF